MIIIHKAGKEHLQNILSVAFLDRLPGLSIDSFAFLSTLIQSTMLMGDKTAFKNLTESSL